MHGTLVCAKSIVCTISVCPNFAYTVGRYSAVAFIRALSNAMWLPINPIIMQPCSVKHWYRIRVRLVYIRHYESAARNVQRSAGSVKNGLHCPPDVRLIYRGVSNLSHYRQSGLRLKTHPCLHSHWTHLSGLPFKYSSRTLDLRAHDGQTGDRCTVDLDSR